MLIVFKVVFIPLPIGQLTMNRLEMVIFMDSAPGPIQPSFKYVTFAVREFALA